MEERTYDVRNAIKMLPNERLRRERQRRGWSREYVAEQIGVADPKTIGRWERGVAFPSSFFLQKLCNLFGMLAQDLGLFPADHDSELQAVAGYLESAGPERYTLHQAITDYTGQYNSAAYERMVEYFIRYVETHETDFDALERETSTIFAARRTSRQIAGRPGYPGQGIVSSRKNSRPSRRYCTGRGAYAESFDSGSPDRVQPHCLCSPGKRGRPADQGPRSSSF